MKILVDIDNVVVNFVAAMIAYLNLRYNKRYKVSDMQAWDFVESPNIDITQKQFFKAFDEFSELNLWDKAPMYRDASEVLNRLSKNHCFIYLSSRSESAKQKTIEQFRANNLPFNDFVVLENESQPVSCGSIAFCQGMNKGEIAKNWGADIAIEDKPSTIQEYINQGVRVVRKKEPYNESIKYRGDISLLESSSNLTGFEKIVNKLELSL